MENEEKESEGTLYNHGPTAVSRVRPGPGLNLSSATIGCVTWATHMTSLCFNISNSKIQIIVTAT